MASIQSAFKRTRHEGSQGTSLIPGERTECLLDVANGSGHSDGLHEAHSLGLFIGWSVGLATSPPKRVGHAGE
jgi:hypothetical protein